MVHLTQNGSLAYSCMAYHMSGLGCQSQTRVPSQGLFCSEIFDGSIVVGRLWSPLLLLKSIPLANFAFAKHSDFRTQLGCHIYCFHYNGLPLPPKAGTGDLNRSSSNLEISTPVRNARECQLALVNIIAFYLLKGVEQLAERNRLQRHLVRWNELS